MSFDTPILLTQLIAIVVDAATETGVARSQVFQLPVKDSPSAHKIHLQHVPEGTFTVLKFGIELSLDGGTTFDELQEWDAFSDPVISLDLARSGLYRLKVKTFTGGTSSIVRIGV